MYITIKIEEINNYPTPSARINLTHACNKMHILHVYDIYRIHIYYEAFELCTCTIDPCVSTKTKYMWLQMFTYFHCFLEFCKEI